MDLKLIKQYFQACCDQQKRLESNWLSFRSSEVNPYSLYIQIAKKYEDKLNVDMIQKFMETFNWQGRISSIDANKVNIQAKFKLHNFDKSNNNEKIPIQEEKKLLKKGIQILIENWGNKETMEMNYDQFSQLSCGRHAMPNSNAKQLDFRLKQKLFENLLSQIEGGIKLQSFKKAVYHEYRNISDLFEMLTAQKQFGIKNLEMLFLNQGQKKQQSQLQKICIRAQLPINFDAFLERFKNTTKSKESKQCKIFYSSVTNKKNDQTPDRLFTTPRRGKARAYPSSTKLTKGQIMELPEESRLVSQFTLGDQTLHKKAIPETPVDLLSDILYLEENFIHLKTNLIMKEDFDLELVYERHGKKIESILNKKFGACNFSAFCRFIMPSTFEHKYLSFIRYQENNQITEATEQMIDELLAAYKNKENSIKELWNNIDKQIVFRSFCQPSQNRIESSKLREHFTKRQTEILAERFDPCKRGYIELQDIK